MPKIEDLSGQKFGKLFIIDQFLKTGKKGRRKKFLNCLCDCGVKSTHEACSVKYGRIVSCGCYNLSVIKKAKTHGLNSHPLKAIRNSMIQRCINSNDKAFVYYGGKGVTVCDQWMSGLLKFVEWAELNGYKKGLEIDRIESEGNYEPENCRWVDRRTNVLNRGFNCNNKTGYKGVSFHKTTGKYRASIGVMSKQIHIGLYKTIKEAATARDIYIHKNNLEKEYKLQVVEL